MIRRWIVPGVLASMWIGALATFHRLPAEIPVHWNLAGNADNWMPRFPGAFLLPAIASGVWLLIGVQPHIDPRRADVERFRETRALLRTMLVCFTAVLQGLTFGIALGWPVDMGRAMWPLLGLLFVGLGNYLPRVRPNWFIGVRTPWTLHSDRVWRATHRLAGRTFVAAGLLALLATVLPREARPWIGFPGLLAAALVPVVYSYLLWKKEQHPHA